MINIFFKPVYLHSKLIILLHNYIQIKIHITRKLNALEALICANFSEASVMEAAASRTPSVTNILNNNL